MNEWLFNFGLYYCSQNVFLYTYFQMEKIFSERKYWFIFSQYAFWVLICFSYVAVLLFKTRSILSHICLFCLTHWFLLLFQKERAFENILCRFKIKILFKNFHKVQQACASRRCFIISWNRSLIFAFDAFLKITFLYFEKQIFGIILFQTKFLCYFYIKKKIWISCWILRAMTILYFIDPKI